MYDLIVIGGGPAGITAGIYSARKKLKTLIISKDLLGQAGKAYWVENYPGIESIQGFQLMEQFLKHLKKFEIEIKEGEEIKSLKRNGKSFFEITTEKKETFSAKAVIIASGRSPRKLEVQGEKEFLGKGVSYCVICDGPLFSGKNVAVVGGGNAAFGAAIELSKICPKVYLLEEADQCKADEINQEKARKIGNIEVLCEAKVREIKGKNFVDALIYEDESSGKTLEIPVEGIFVEIGSVPATGFVGDLVDFNERDEIRIDFYSCSTKTPGLFAAGDVTSNRDKQVVIACGEGAKAALSSYYYIQNLKTI